MITGTCLVAKLCKTACWCHTAHTHYPIYLGSISLAGYHYRNYGCGAVYPEAVEGCTILDLGSGAGLDCFVLSKMVGPKGHVTGIDMTKEQVLVTVVEYIGLVAYPL